MACPPTAHVIDSPYVCPCGTTIVKASNVATFLTAGATAVVCCRNTEEVSVMVDEDALSAMVHTMGGSAMGCVAAVHGHVRVPPGGVTATPTLKGGSCPTAAFVTGGVQGTNVSRVAGMVNAMGGNTASPDAVCWHSTTNVTLRIVAAVCTTKRGMVTTPVCGFAGTDRSDVSVVVASTTTRSVARVAAVSEQETSATTAKSWRVSTTTSSCGSTGHGDDASDAMKVDGSADMMRASIAAITNKIGAVTMVRPHTVHDACTCSSAACGASNVTFTDVSIVVTPDALTPTTSDQASATSRALCTVAFTSSTLQIAVVVAPLPPIAGESMFTPRCRGSGVYPTTTTDGAT